MTIIELFADGNMAEVLRIGDSVRKSRPAWWLASREVLSHLEHHGYPQSPRVLNETDTYIELGYINGETVPADLAAFEDEGILEQLGQHVRRLHDTLAGLQLLPEADYVPWAVPPPTCTILCHNDISPWNTVMLDGLIQGFVDWDLVSPGSREWELAWMCWRWAPIYPSPHRTTFSAEQQANRCITLLKAYGTDALDLDQFVNLIDRRMHCALATVEVLGAQRITGFDHLLDQGLHLSGHDDRDWLDLHRSVFESALRKVEPHRGDLIPLP